jgi:hypothetical protein
MRVLRICILDELVVLHPNETLATERYRYDTPFLPSVRDS